MNASIFAAVRARGRDRCEYCQMHQSLQGATFHVEHVLPVSGGGPSTLDNLAWCCPCCNLHKSSRTAAIDPETDQVARLSHPRRDVWPDQFYWVGCRLVGKTATGRATVAALKLNSDRRIRIREAEARFLLFPPDVTRGTMGS